MADRRRIAVIGLPAVGKSSIVAALHGKTADGRPTEGVNKSSLPRGGFILDLLDLGGSAQVRKFW